MSQSHPRALMDSIPAALTPQQPILLDRLRAALQSQRFAADTVARFVEWNRRYILHHRLRHPQTMGRQEIEQFLAQIGRLGYSARVQAEARQAVAFLYCEERFSSTRSMPKVCTISVGTVHVALWHSCALRIGPEFARVGAVWRTGTRGEPRPGTA